MLPRIFVLPRHRGAMLSFVPWDEREIRLERMEGQPASGFDCGRESQNRFLYARAWRDQKAGVSVTYLLYVSGILAGYLTVLTDKIDLGPGERLSRVFYMEIPAIKLAQLAVDRRFAGNGLGKLLVSAGVHLVRELRQKVGCRVVTLEAQPDLVTWYEGQAFRPSLEEQRVRVERARAEGRDAERLPVSMRFDLREAGR
jgi:GNAT superfamily N-acetyltransferase